MAVVVGVVLAAGPATRFEGGHKLLATFDGEPLVRHAVKTLLGGELDATVTVVGHAGDAVASVLADLPVDVVSNPAYEEGMAASVRVGAAEARRREADAAVFLPGDMPCVDRATVTRLRTAFERHGAPIVIPEASGRRGNPVLFGAALFDELDTLSGDVGGRAVFERRSTRRVPVDDPGIHRDIDTRADLEELRQLGCGETRS